MAPPLLQRPHGGQGGPLSGARRPRRPAARSPPRPPPAARPRPDRPPGRPRGGAGAHPPPKPPADRLRPRRRGLLGIVLPPRRLADQQRRRGLPELAADLLRDQSRRWRPAGPLG